MNPWQQRKAIGKRETLKNASGTHYLRRTATGQFKDSVNKGRSLAADRRQHAKTAIKAGCGDKGDRRR